MARTRKAIQPLNLNKYDVLIEDKGPRSEYFKLSQFDGYLYGGRNAFLIAGANVLKPNSTILVEILNKEGTTVYSAPIPSFLEGNSRLIQIDVYSDTPIGVGKLVILGSANTYIDGTGIPDNWINKYNVRWESDVIISPLVENKTTLRFQKTPELFVQEKFYPITATSSFSQSVTVDSGDYDLNPINFNIYQNGYLIKLKNPTPTNVFTSDQLGGNLVTQISTPVVSEVFSGRLPLTKILNSTTAESRGAFLTSSLNTVISKGFVSGSGSGYVTQLEPLGFITASTSVANVIYQKIQESPDTGSVVSFAKLKLTNLNTLSGEIHKIRVSYKASTEPGDYVALADIPAQVEELLAVDSGSKIVNVGQFNKIKISDYWYAATMSLSKDESFPTLPAYYLTSSYGNLSVSQSSQVLIDAAYTIPELQNNTFKDNRSYFIGTKNDIPIELFANSEYTLKFDAIVSKLSASLELIQSDYSVEVYLTEHPDSPKTLLSTDTRGQLLGTLTPLSTFKKQFFENVQLNFKPNIIKSGKFSLRFIVYGGFWNISNMSLKVAQENLFSPDEISVLVPNVNFSNKLLTFKTEYLDINNNSTGIFTLSSPTYFIGSTPVVGTGNTTTVSGFPFTGSAIITGSLSITGSFAFTEGGTYVTGSASLADIDSAVIASTSQYLVLSQSANLSNERILSLSSRFSASDGGANNNYSVDLSNNMRTSTVGIIIDGGETEITTGEKSEILIPFSGSIQSWALLADRSGSITIDIWKSTYATYPPTASDSIVASEKPFISASVKNTSSSLVGWTASINKNDTLKFYVSASSTIQRVNLTLELLRL